MVDIPPDPEADDLARHLAAGLEPSGVDAELAETWRHREAVAEHTAQRHAAWVGGDAPETPALGLPTIPRPLPSKGAPRSAIDALDQVPPFHYQEGWRRKLSKAVASVVLKLSRFLISAHQRVFHAVIDRQDEERRTLADLTEAVERLGQRVAALEARAYAADGERLGLRVDIAELAADQAAVEVAVDQIRRDLPGESPSDDR